jgi:hypothetical protein
MTLFFRQSRYALWLAWGQVPLRLVFMQPSLSLGLWLIQAAGVSHFAALRRVKNRHSLALQARVSGHKTIANACFGQQMLRTRRIGFQLLS